MVVFSAGAAAATDETAAAPRCPRNGNPAVRTDDSYAQALIDEGLEHSPTFAFLVQQLQDTDLVAIIQPSSTMSLNLSGYLTFVSTTSSCRYVRIKFTTRYNGAHAVGIIAHELQHAVEVGLHPEVVDADSLRALYEERGRASGGLNAFESNEAIEIGRTVLREMFKPATATALDADR